MSDKSISLVVTGEDEDTENDVDVQVTVDFINKENVYLKIGDGQSVAIANADMRRVTRFLTEEMWGN